MVTPHNDATPGTAAGSSAASSGFLSSLRVVEIGGGMAAAFCGRLLADAGADVLKVEPPDGDDLRRTGPYVGGAVHPERSIPYLALNAGKRSVSLDPTTAEGRERLEALLAAADVLVDDLGPGGAARWGIDPADLGRRHPALIHATISPFGHDGPFAGYQAEELTVYALGGLMYHIGAYDREPLKHGPAQAALVAGLNAATGVVFALLERDRDGQGQRVDVSVQESVALLLSALELTQYAYTGGVARRDGKDGPGAEQHSALRRRLCRAHWLRPRLGDDGALPRLTRALESASPPLPAAPATALP
ncbi:MAG: CoA transferase [Dehalococcoidia bacterium]